MSQDLDAERLLTICAHATADVLRSDEVNISAKVKVAAEFVETAREIHEKREGFHEPVQIEN